MASKRDYYDVLGVSRTATEDQLKQAYRALARKFHPDVNKAEDAGAKFAELTEAYDVLADPERRKAYDRFGHEGARMGVGAGAGPGRSAQVDLGDLGSIFEEMFGGGRSGFGGGRSPFGGGGSPFGESA
ncbi:MAG: DnaJ domain-containing protein, partial [Phycisphaerales bacterium]|nr:DnaJ domain-containing protein [Phycisphaerales bacterium]